MQTKTKVISVTGLVVGSVVFGMILASNLDLGRSASAQKQQAPAAQAAAQAPPATARPQPSLLLPSFADIAEQVMPAVVSVTTTEIVKASDRRRQNPFGGEGFDFFFPDRRRGEDEEDRKEVSGGSGFVIESEGFILTNNHVIEGADKVVVKLGDDEYTAKVVGRDPASDLALLKIDGPRPFPVVRLGDSEKIRVGEWVMAIGDPLQYEKTVTVGIISGKGRFAGLPRASALSESLLQTDAAINFGNSGGPLVNVSGEVIGINTAISRMAQNIGFAVPINLVKGLLPGLKKGKVVRGFLGVTIQTVDRTLSEAFELKTPGGALVQAVEKGKPGDKAGLKHGDVIVKVDDVNVKTNHDLIDYVSSKVPGTKVTVTFIRRIKERTEEKTVQVVLEERPDERDPNAPEEAEPTEAKEKIGIAVTDVTAQLRRTYKIPADVKGVAITNVKAVSSAADAGLLEGDVILEVNGAEVGGVADFQAEMKKAKGRYVRFYVSRGAPRPQTFIAAVKLEE